MRVFFCVFAAAALSMVAAGAESADATVALRCEVIDASSEHPLAARVYVRSDDGR